MKLLIVDDSSIMRYAIETYLSDYHFNIVGKAKNGVEAITLFKEQLPELVTLDITMPEMDGISCLEQMMQINPKTKVIIITALNDKLTGLEAIRKGAKSFMNKPIIAENLRRTFEKIIYKDQYDRVN